MLKDYWGKGAGAGSFRFLFPAYQQYYPEIFAFKGIRLYWEHAHNDVVEIAVELGVPGVLLLLAAGFYLVARLVKGYFWENPLSGCVVFGNFLLVCYAWWDFPFQCPAILVLWCSLAIAATMWISFEELNLKG
jgi:O-antigen ligase